MFDIALIDHYDSFTFNLIDWLRGSSFSKTDGRVKILHVPYDDHQAMREVLRFPRPLVLSPGPKSPQEAQPTLDLVQALLGKVPILGVCLGHQILAHVAGAQIVRSVWPRHGATKRILIEDRQGLFAGYGQQCDMASYHSLVPQFDSLPKDWYITARCARGEVQGLEYRPVTGAWAFGVQFHPESFLSRQSELLLRNWLSQFLKASIMALTVSS